MPTALLGIDMGDAVTERIIRAICFDWGGTLMSEDGPADLPMSQWEHVERLPGALEAVRALHRNYPLCIATNAAVSRPPMIERALDRVGLREYFTHIFCCTELGHRKESPEFWLAVAKALGIAPGHLAMVGDTLEPDVLVPRRLGIHAVWLKPAALASGPSADMPAVASLGEFVRLIERAA
jgi:aminoglycoside 6'-N-acetyltransferase I